MPGRQSAGTVHYSHSVCYREPGGVLFELANEEPGFTVDVPVEGLGSRASK